MLDSKFSNSMTIPKLNKPKIILNDIGYKITSNNINTSIGWRHKNEKNWNIYKPNDLITPIDDFEVILFKPGYEIPINYYNK